jgi:protein TonB
MMRRRDATTGIGQHTQRTRWRTAACLGLSLSMHAGLLVAAAISVLNTGQAARLIRVSIVSGGASPGSGGTPAQHAAGSPEAAAPPPEAAPRVQPKDQEPGQRFAKLARGHVRAPRLRQPSAPPSTLVVTSNAPAIAGSVPGAGSSEASGANSASGSNGNAGAGVGNGSGPGAGDGIDQRTYCVYCPEPHYPLLARTRGWQGSVDVGLVVLADGSVDAASLRRSSGYGVLDEAAIAVARRSRFKPPASSGLRAPLHGRIEYRFELTNAR